MLRHVLRFGEGAPDSDPRHLPNDRPRPRPSAGGDARRPAPRRNSRARGPRRPPEDDVTAYLDAAGYHDEELGRAVASVTAGNPFFMIEVLRHVDESGGRWDPSTLPQGVREAVGRRLARLTPDANEALLAGAVVGGRFSSTWSSGSWAVT